MPCTEVYFSLYSYTWLCILIILKRLASLEIVALTISAIGLLVAVYYGHQQVKYAKLSVTGHSSNVTTPSVSEMSNTKKYSVFHCEDVLEWGWSGEKLLDNLIDIDYKTIQGLNIETEGTNMQWIPVFMEHPKTWALLCNKPASIVGYWHFVALKEEAFNKVVSGKLLDSEIVPSILDDLDVPGDYKMYFVSVGVLNEARRLGTKVLMNSLFESLSQLASEGVFFNEICSNAFSQKGIELSIGLGLTKLKEHESHGQVYSGKVKDFIGSSIFSKYPELQKMYKKHFKIR